MADFEKQNVKVIKGISLDEIKLDNTPLILRGIQLGQCVSKWASMEYLKSKVAADKKVTVHVCPQAQMNFIKKNFEYKVMDFHALVDNCFSKTKNNSEFYYLRAIGDNQRKDVALLSQDFPALSDDIDIPHVFPIKNLFSSVLRISSANAQLWTHYDIMNNILMQVVGTKKVTLFDPLEAANLYLHGDKSRILDVENPNLDEFPSFKNVKVHYIADLFEGDILYIPALWFHNVTALTPSIAVNVFWKNLEERFYDVKDLYGNRDLLPAQRSFQSLDKIFRNLDEMPEPFRRFYAIRLIENLKQRFDV